MSSEESETKVEVSEEEKIEELAARVMDAVHDGILGKIMKCAVSHAMGVLLKKEVTKLADEVLSFRRMLSEKMLADQSVSFKDPVCLEKLSDGFEDGWEAWKSSWEDRDELAYRAFVKVMTSPSE